MMNVKTARNRFIRTARLDFSKNKNNVRLESHKKKQCFLLKIFLMLTKMRRLHQLIDSLLIILTKHIFGGQKTIYSM